MSRSAEYEAETLIDRAAFLSAVGISESTLSRWIREGVVVPTRSVRRGRSVQLFAASEVTFARAVRALLSQHHGQLRLQDVVAVVRGEVELPEDRHNPVAPLVPSTPPGTRETQLALELVRKVVEAERLSQELAEMKRTRNTLTRSSGSRDTH